MAQLQSTSITGSLIVTGGITGSISGSIIAPGSTTQVLYNNGGVVAGASELVYSGSFVGIGVSNPGYKLDIQGNPGLITINTNGAVLSGGQFISNTGDFAAASSGTDVTLKAGGTTLMTLKSSGNVGIGTTSPSTALTIAKAASTAPVLTLQTTDSTSNGYISWKNSSGTQNAAIGTNYGVSDTGAIEFISGSVTNMILRSNGNLGIGTTDPTSQMSGTYGLGIYHASYPGVGFKNSTTSWLWYGSSSTLRMWNSSAGDILTGTTGGNIGIGTSSPSQKLDVSGNIFASGYVQGGTAYISDQSGVSSFGSNSGTRSIRIGRDGTANDIFITGSNGNVGIGTTSPSTKLHVVGTGLFTDVLTFAGDTRYGVSKVYNSSTGDMFGMEQVSAAQTGASGAATRIFADDASNNYISLGSYTDATTFVDRLKILTNNGYIGIGTSSPQTRLHIDGQTKLINNYFAEWRNVVNFAYDGTGTGGYVITTPLLVGSTYEMSIIHVIGYGYGGSTLIDFKVVLYSYISAPTNYSIVDNGNDGLVKYIGKDSNGYLTICFGGLSDSNYFYRFNVNFYATRYPGNNYSSGWSIAQTTSSSYGMSTLYSLSPAVTQLVNGNVGIGTQNPGVKLEVNSNSTLPIIRSRYNSTYYTDYDSNGIDFRGTSQTFDIKDNGTSAIRIASGGNVGIGTTSPSYKLQVNGEIVNSTSVGSTGDPGIALGNGHRLGFDQSGVRSWTMKATGGNLVVYSGDGNGNFNVSMDSILRNAFVGVISAYGTNYASFSHTSRAGAGEYSFLSGNAGETYINAKSGYPIYFRVNNIDKVIINDAGYVGIGTTTPSVPLEVVGAISGSSINFGQDTLNYYDVEDTWYPEIDTSNNDIVGVNYATQEGTYTRIGDVVHAWFYISVANMANAGTGTAIIKTLPFTSGTQVTWFSSLITVDASLILPGPAGTQLKGYVAGASTDITLHLDDSGANGFGFRQDAGWKDSGGVISGYVVYKAQ